MNVLSGQRATARPHGWDARLLQYCSRRSAGWGEAKMPMWPGQPAQTVGELRQEQKLGAKPCLTLRASFKIPAQ